MYNKLAGVVTKANVLAKLIRLRLRQPLLPHMSPEEALKRSMKGGEDPIINNKKQRRHQLELAAIAPAISALMNIGKLLKVGQALSNQHSLTKVLLNKDISIPPAESQNVLYNLKEQTWDILKPGDEKRTRHLKWRY